MHGYPAWVIFRVWGWEARHKRQGAVFVLPVCPEGVGCEIGRVEVGFCRVEDHAVDSGCGGVGVVLDVAIQGAGARDGEDVAVAGVLVEGVAVDGVGGFPGGEEEDCASVGLGAVCFGCSLSLAIVMVYL